MIDLQPAPVPDLSDEWISSHARALVGALPAQRGTPVTAVAFAVATATAVAAAGLLLFGGSEQPAFAGWSAAPTTPATGQISAAEAACQAQLGGLRPSNKGTDATSLVPEVNDVRGPYTVTVFDNSDQDAAVCVSGPGGTSVRWLTRSTEPVPPGSIAVDQVSTVARDGQPYTLVEGRTGDGVTNVVMTLGNGDEVTATTGNGMFVDWWPGSQTIASATVTTTTGVSTQTMNVAGPGNPPATKPATGASAQSSDGVAHVNRQFGPPIRTP